MKVCQAFLEWKTALISFLIISSIRLLKILLFLRSLFICIFIFLRNIRILQNCNETSRFYIDEAKERKEFTRCLTYLYLTTAKVCFTNPTVTFEFKWVTVLNVFCLWFDSRDCRFLKLALISDPCISSSCRNSIAVKLYHQFPLNN